MKSGQFRDYENYIIYSDGKVWSKNRNKFITEKITWDGYARTQLYKHNKFKNYHFHKLVAEVFIDNPLNRTIVNHIDGNRLNNDVTNLEWCTQSENIQHAWDNGLCTHQFNCKSKSIPVDQYTKDGEFIRTWPSQMEVERVLGILHVNVSRACKNFKWTACGFKFKFHETCND